MKTICQNIMEAPAKILMEIHCADQRYIPKVSNLKTCKGSHLQSLNYSFHKSCWFVLQVVIVYFSSAPLKYESCIMQLTEVTVSTN